MYTSIYEWMLYAIKLKIKLLFAVQSFTYSLPCSAFVQCNTIHYNSPATNVKLVMFSVVESEGFIAPFDSFNLYLMCSSYPSLVQ